MGKVYLTVRRIVGLQTASELRRLADAEHLSADTGQVEP